MKVLLIHLSDIHFSSDSDPILQRTDRIIDAVKNLTPRPDAVVCAISGDIANKGADNEYALAMDFTSKLEAGLNIAFSPVTTQFIVVPGNHDCDFRDSMTGIRTTILPAVLKDPSLLNNTAHTSVCTEPQRHFSWFQNSVQTNGPTEGWLFHEQRIEIGSETLAFLCYNTAVTSQIREQAGTLIFPTNLIPRKKEQEALVVSIYHHPSPWLEPNCAREFRKRTEATSDLILTGHEHDPSRRRTITPSADVTYIEGGVLQEHNQPDQSSFNVLLINTDTNQKRLLQYSWKSDRYATNLGDSEQYYLWEGFSQNPYRTQSSFQLNEEFATYLLDPEITLTHRAKGQLNLADIFIYPDLKRIRQPGEGGQESVRSEDVLDYIDNNPSILIVGDDQSGKTSLAKRVFSHLREKGDIPILLNAGSARLRADSIAVDLEAAFLRNYLPESLELYRQVDRARRVLIVDNYHHLPLSPRERQRLLEAIREHCFRIILLGNETALTIQDLIDSTTEDGEDSGGPAFKHLSIRPFGYIQQNKLIERWLLLGADDASEDTTEFVSNVEKLRNTMETVFGKNYVPAFPAYILSILQANESGTELNLKANTHGYFYEIFIKQSIARYAGSSISINIVTTYLAHLAYEMFKLGQRSLTDAEWNSFYQQLQARIEVLPDRSILRSRLIAMQLLWSTGDTIQFKQSYIYYYFLALHFHNNINTQEIGEAINQLAKQLYREESASTLLFLSHHSKDKRILDTLLAVAESQYQGAPEARLDSDVDFVNELHGKLPRREIPDGPLKELRAQELQEREDRRAQELEFEADNQKELEDATSLLGRLNASLKTIQILGQFLKNFPADLERQQKDRILQATTQLAARTLGDYLRLVKEHEGSILEGLAFMISDRKRNLAKRVARKKAEGALATLIELFASGMVSRLSYSIGSSELLPTFERVLGGPADKAEPQPTPFLRLTLIALQLGHSQAFPDGRLSQECQRSKNNPLVMRILQGFVARHLFMFPVQYRVRQRLASLLSLDYKKVNLPKREELLLK